MGTLSFRPRLLTTAAALAFVALTISLGNWQRHRAEEKRERQATLEAREREAPVVLTGAVEDAQPLLYRKVRATGEFVPARQVFVDNQVVAGRAGFTVVTPLRLRGASDVVLVNRGWIARDGTYPRAPEVPVPAGEVTVSGVATQPPARFLELSGETVTGNVWQNLSIARFRGITGLPTLPVVILADAATPGLVPVHERPDTGIERHVEYEFTWFALAATALALWVALNLERTPR